MVELDGGAWRSGSNMVELDDEGHGGVAATLWSWTGKRRGGAEATRERENTGQRRQESEGGERLPRGKEGDRVATARGVGVQMTPSFGSCLLFHVGRLSREETGIPEGLWTPKEALDVLKNHMDRLVFFSRCVYYRDGGR